jgi:hypothetical protein
MKAACFNPGLIWSWSALPAVGEQQEYGAVGFGPGFLAGSFVTAHDQIAAGAHLPLPLERLARDQGDLQDMRARFPGHPAPCPLRGAGSNLIRERTGPGGVECHYPTLHCTASARPLAGAVSLAWGSGRPDPPSQSSLPWYRRATLP